MTQQSFPFANTNNLTPMMKQYLDVKMQHQDSILFYRMGDFYEMFFEDAVVAAPILGIALTKRGQHLGADIPMCGIPFHSSDSYVEKLIEKGNKVAICEQMEKPEEAKKRGYKEVVRREVIRIITPGTLTEENLLKNNSSNFLLAIANFKEEIALSWADISTGEFYFCKSSLISLSNDLARISPKEILISDKAYQNNEMNAALIDYRRILTIQANNLFDYNKAEHKIKHYYNVISSESFDISSSASLIACGAILEYVELTQKVNNLRINYPKKLDVSLFMTIDAATRRNLEINVTTSGERTGSLFDLINQTKTASGSRLLNQYLANPLIDVEAINNRLDLVEFFLNNSSLLEELTSLLMQMGDVERALSRLGFNRGGPRDLQIIKQSLATANLISNIFAYFEGEININLKNHLDNLINFDDLSNQLEEALANELPMLARDGGFIKPEYNARLDQLYELKDNGQNQIQALKQKYIKESGINSLKINHNNVLGYFIDITPQHVSKIKEDIFIHRQTLANSVRYTTMELRSLEGELLNVSDNIIKLELHLYTQLVENVLNKADMLLLFASSIAVIDVACNFAYLASKNSYVRPNLDNSCNFNIILGRHPVIENALRKQKQEFVANDCHFQDEQNLWLITGPNMAGKSTFLRQNALIVILAQIGCYVPSKSASFGVVDKIFSRVGAADDLARGRSTFMVEMVETANILNNATARSLIILDEIGRGTSTYDGVSIASACLEFIHNKLKSRALFATHYHELTALKSQLASLVCYTMQIKEWQNKVIFLHKVISGVADKSYGIHVAEMAGLPKQVICRAKAVLENLEKEHNYAINLDFQSSDEKHHHPVIDFINNLDIDELSPKEALEKLYQLKKLT
ncbi:MAG: DNA mismatch repair protein MutS [Rickettsiales bacterium]